MIRPISPMLGRSLGRSDGSVVTRFMTHMGIFYSRIGVALVRFLQRQVDIVWQPWSCETKLPDATQGALSMCGAPPRRAASPPTLGRGGGASNGKNCQHGKRDQNALACAMDHCRDGSL